MSNRAIERLRLQAALYPPSLITSLSGHLVHKRTLASAEQEAEFQKVLSEAISLFGTSYAPRAEVGLRIHIHGKRGRSPSLEKITKFYLDLTQGHLVKDDRQIRYLMVHHYPSVEHGHGTGEVCFQFERLTRIKKRYDLAWRYRHLVDCDDELGLDDQEDALRLEAEELRSQILSMAHGSDFLADVEDLMDPEMARDMREHRVRFEQGDLLERSRVHWCERPLATSSKHEQERRMNRIPHPLVVELPALDLCSESGGLQVVSEDRFEKFLFVNPWLRPLWARVDLDIQIWYETDLEKDLDNVMAVILRAFRKTWGASGKKVSGVRVYANRTSAGSPPASIRIKFLGSQAISNWRSRVTKILEAAYARSLSWC